MEHYRRLAAEDERFLPDLAMTLSNLGIALTRKGRIEEAIKRFGEAVQIIEPLASVMVWLLPDLSKYLFLLGLTLLSRGNRKEGWQACVRPYKPLRIHRPTYPDGRDAAEGLPRDPSTPPKIPSQVVIIPPVRSPIKTVLSSPLS